MAVKKKLREVFYAVRFDGAGAGLRKLRHAVNPAQPPITDCCRSAAQQAHARKNAGVTHGGRRQLPAGDVRCLRNPAPAPRYLTVNRHLSLPAKMELTSNIINLPY